MPGIHSCDRGELRVMSWGDLIAFVVLVAGLKFENVGCCSCPELDELERQPNFCGSSTSTTTRDALSSVTLVPGQSVCLDVPTCHFLPPTMESTMSSPLVLVVTLRFEILGRCCFS